MKNSTKTFIRDLIILVFVLTCTFVVTRDANANTNVRCYFPGYNEVFIKDVQNTSPHNEEAVTFKFTVNSKQYTVPANACVVEEDL